MKQIVDCHGLLTDELSGEMKKRASTNIFDLKLEAALEIIDGTFAPTKVKESQKRAITELLAFCKDAARCGVPLRVLLRVADKKSLFLVNAKSVREVCEIRKPSISHFEGNGLIITQKYHIPEEELMLLGIASRLGKLTLRAQERFVYLYEHCFGQREEDEHE